MLQNTFSLRSIYRCYNSALMEDLETWIKRAQKGDKSAFENIYNFFYKRIHRYCDYNLRKKEIAEDIAQETFIKCWKSLPSFSFRKGGSFQAFLFRIARNLIIDESRKKKTIKLEEYLEEDADQNLEEELDKRDKESRIKDAINKLEELDKQIIILRYFEDLSFSEVEEVTSIKSGALRVRTHRILKKLSEELGKNE